MAKIRAVRMAKVSRWFGRNVDGPIDGPKVVEFYGLTGLLTGLLTGWGYLLTV
jgi:hypothetical protein|tara:strand:+ start:384 stop:542 length:159 start_codon:yes stop_codon:yes gene_type:complete